MNCPICNARLVDDTIGSHYVAKDHRFIWSLIESRFSLEDYTRDMYIFCSHNKCEVYFKSDVNKPSLTLFNITTDNVGDLYKRIIRNMLFV